MFLIVCALKDILFKLNYIGVYFMHIRSIMKIQLSDHFNYKKLITFTIPTILMMIFTSIYGIVDGVFVSNLAGDIAFKAINLIMPFLMILATVGFMFGTGGAAVVSNTLGEGDNERANRYFSLLVYVAFVIGVILAVISFIFMKEIVSLLGGEGDILISAVNYGRIIVCALPFLILQYIFQSFFVAAEKPRLGLIVILIAGCTNMVLDALLVTLLPQEMKLIGAAIATGFSQFLGGFIPFIYFSKKNNSILKLGKTRFEGKILLKTCTNGSSELVSNIAINIVAILYNLQLLKYAGDDGIAAYGVMMYIGFIFVAIFIGYSSGVAPIVGYHNGANNSKEKKNIFKKSMILVLIASISMIAISFLLARPLSQIFVGYNKELLEMTVNGMKIFSLSYLFMGIAIFGSSFFTALNDGVTSAIISFLRTLVFQLGAVIFLPIILKSVDGIWYSVVVAELMAFILTIICLKIKRKKFEY